MVVLVVFLGGMTEGEKVSRRPVKMWEAFHCVYVQQQALAAMLMMHSSTSEKNLMRCFSC